jgi:hypothetical protein
MRRISIAVALYTLLLVSICSAQQTASENPANRKSGVGTDTVINCTTAKNSYIPVFTAVMPPNITICNSAIFQVGGNIGIGTATPVAALDVNGATNTSLYYQIGGSAVLSIGSAADDNLFLGVGAGASNVFGQGAENTFSGNEAGLSNTTGSANTFSGSGAGYDNSTGANNTFSGAGAGFHNTTGGSNTFTGWRAGLSNTTGQSNTFTGDEAGQWHATGDANTSLGRMQAATMTPVATIPLLGPSLAHTTAAAPTLFTGSLPVLTLITATTTSTSGIRGVPGVVPNPARSALEATAALAMDRKPRSTSHASTVSTSAPSPYRSIQTAN